MSKQSIQTIYDIYFIFFSASSPLISELIFWSFSLVCIFRSCRASTFFFLFDFIPTSVLKYFSSLLFDKYGVEMVNQLFEADSSKLFEQVCFR